MAKVHPVILAGGVGSRLWPLSRTNRPKQFLDPLQQGKSLLQSTIERAQAVSDIPALIVGNVEHRFLLDQQISKYGLKQSNVLLESCGKNTAPSILISALKVLETDSDAMLLIMPSDHFLDSADDFAHIALKSVKALEQQSLSTSELAVCLFGIKSSYANVHYGYLQPEILNDDLDNSLVPLKAFKEKPSREQASLYLELGYLWNSGMVLAKASDLIVLFELHQPELFKQLNELYVTANEKYSYQCVQLETVPAISFDYAILEDCQNLYMTKLNGQWDDLGSWPCLIERRHKLGLKDNVFAQGKHHLILADDNMVLIDDMDLLMVANLDQLADVAAMGDYLDRHNLQHLLKGLEVNRPWGSFKILSQGEGYLVKHLTVLPGHKISLQSHDKRTENWVVVKGRANVERDEQGIELNVGETISILPGQKHRLSNESDTALDIIEVQTGSELSEDDIVRYDDQYFRHNH